MLGLIIFSLTLITTDRVQAIDDNPFTNFTYELPLDDVPGDCKPIKAWKVSADKSKYEGRWHALHYEFNKEKHDAIGCSVWDTYFDKKGDYHNSVHLFVDGEKYFWRHTGIPVDEDNGIYDILDIPGRQKLENKLKNTFFYIDNEVQAFLIYECLPGQNKHKELFIIGLRRLEDAEKNKEKIDAIYKEYAARGGANLKKNAKQENCKYPEELKHPYNN